MLLWNLIIIVFGLSDFAETCRGEDRVEGRTAEELSGDSSVYVSITQRVPKRSRTSAPRRVDKEWGRGYLFLGHTI